MDDIDIIERIDAQLEAGEPEGGFDHGDPNFPRCPHCDRHWHGLPLTRRVAFMYSMGRFDPAYVAEEDDSEIVCPGSDFVGPRRPTTSEAELSKDRRYPIGSPLGDIQMSIVLNTEAMRESLRRFREQLQAFTESAITSGNIVSGLINLGDPQRARQLRVIAGIDGSRQRGGPVMFFHTGYSMYDDDQGEFVHFYRGQDVSYHYAVDDLNISGYQPAEIQPPLALRREPIKITFGPQNWYHEMFSINRIPQFPRTYPRASWTMSPLERTVASLWPDFHRPPPELCAPAPPPPDWQSMFPADTPPPPSATSLADLCRRPHTQPAARRRPTPARSRR